MPKLGFFSKYWCLTAIRIFSDLDNEESQFIVLYVLFCKLEAAKSNHQFTVHRYVDDIFLNFDDHNLIDYEFWTFNSIHQKIKFTKEHVENNKLAFLVVRITKNSNCIETSIFRKKAQLRHALKMVKLCTE